MQRDGLRERREWLMRRNCSLTPAQTCIAYGVLMLITLTVGTFFALRGAWPVLAFAVLVVAGVVVAVIENCRHALDQEHVVLECGRLLVEYTCAGQLRQTWLEPFFIRISLPQGPHELIVLESKGQRIELGTFLSDSRRRAFGLELRAELQGGLFNA